MAAKALFFVVVVVGIALIVIRLVNQRASKGQ